MAHRKMFAYIIIHARYFSLKNLTVNMVGCWDKANCPHVRPGPIGGVFLRDPSPYLREFRRKSWKTANNSEYGWLLG